MSISNIYANEGNFPDDIEPNQSISTPVEETVNMGGPYHISLSYPITGLLPTSGALPQPKYDKYGNVIDEIKMAYRYLASMKPLVAFTGGSMLYEEGYEKGVFGARVAVDKKHCDDKQICNSPNKTEVIFIPRSEVDEYLLNKKQ